MIGLSFSAILAAAIAAQTTEDGAASGSRWTVRDQIQIPAMTANHVVGGIGAGVTLERGLFAFDGEGQILFVTTCDTNCGPAYAGAVGSR